MCLTLNAWGQKGLYLKPSAGIGFGNVRENSNTTGYPSLQKVNVAALNVTAGIGYQVKKWRFESGIGYLRSGVRRDMYSSSVYSRNYPLVDTTTSHTYFHHIIIPLRIAYQLRMNRKLSLYPTLGGAVSFNMGWTEKAKFSAYGSYDFKQTDMFFPYPLRPITLLGEAQLNASYKVSKNIDIFGGPALQYMINPMVKTTDPFGNPLKADQYPYTIMINAGLNWYLPTHKVSVDTPGK